MDIEHRISALETRCRRIQAVAITLAICLVTVFMLGMTTSSDDAWSWLPKDGSGKHYLPVKMLPGGSSTVKGTVKVEIDKWPTQYGSRGNILVQQK